MRKRLNRQTVNETEPRTVVSLTMPHTDWVRLKRASGMVNESVSQFLRDAARDRVASLLTDDPPQLRAA